jgi:hypothetical protein
MVIIDKHMGLIAVVEWVLIGHKFIRNLCIVGHNRRQRWIKYVRGAKLGLRIIQALTVIRENRGDCPGLQRGKLSRLTSPLSPGGASAIDNPWKKGNNKWHSLEASITVTDSKPSVLAESTPLPMGIHKSRSANGGPSGNGEFPVCPAMKQMLQHISQRPKTLRCPNGRLLITRKIGLIVCCVQDRCWRLYYRVVLCY